MSNLETALWIQKAYYIWNRLHWNLPNIVEYKSQFKGGHLNSAMFISLLFYFIIFLNVKLFYILE